MTSYRSAGSMRRKSDHPTAPAEYSACAVGRHSVHCFAPQESPASLSAATAKSPMPAFQTSFTPRHWLVSIASCLLFTALPAAACKVKAIFVQPPVEVPEKAVLFTGEKSEEIELPQRNLSVAVELPPGISSSPCFLRNRLKLKSPPPPPRSKSPMPGLAAFCSFSMIPPTRCSQPASFR